MTASSVTTPRGLAVPLHQLERNPVEPESIDHAGPGRPGHAVTQVAIGQKTFECPGNCACGIVGAEDPCLFGHDDLEGPPPATLMTGTPHARASTKTAPKPSCRLGAAKTYA